MYYSHLSTLRDSLTEDKIVLLKEYFGDLTSNTKEYITPSKIMNSLSIDYETSVLVLLKLETAGVVKRYYGVKCPECSMLIKTGSTIKSLDLKNIGICYSCDEEITITEDDIVVLFRLNNDYFPFNKGQQKERYVVRAKSSTVVAPEDGYVLFEKMEKSLSVIAQNAFDERTDREKKRDNDEKDKQYEKLAIKGYKKNIKISIMFSFLGYIFLVATILYIYKQYGFSKLSIFVTFGSSLIPFGINYIIMKFFPQDIDLIKRLIKSKE